MTPPTTTRSQFTSPGQSMPPGFPWWFALLFLISQVPLYGVRYINMSDYPNHLARVHLLLQLGSDPALQSFYAFRPGIAPNLALDTVVPVLARLVGLELGFKLFISGATLLLCSGTVFLARALSGRITHVALASLLFSQSAQFQFGLINFIFGIGLAFWLLGAWILVGMKRDTLTVSLFAMGATALYLTHLSALGLYVLGVLSVESSRVRGALSAPRLVRQAGAVFIQLLPAVLLHAFAYEPGTAQPHTSLDGSWIESLTENVRLLLIAPALAVGVDYAAALVAFCACAAAYLAWRHSWASFSAPGLRLAGLLAGSILLLPPVSFGATLVSFRLTLPLAAVLLASLHMLHESRATKRWMIGFVLGATSLLSWQQHQSWAGAEGAQSALRQAMNTLPVGSTVAAVAVRSPGRIKELTLHAASWCAIDRHCLLSSLYLRPYQPVLVGYRAEFIALTALARLDIEKPPPPMASLVGAYEYAVVFGPPDATGRWSAGTTTIFLSEAVRIVRL